MIISNRLFTESTLRKEESCYRLEKFKAKYIDSSRQTYNNPEDIFELRKDSKELLSCYLKGLSSKCNRLSDQELSRKSKEIIRLKKIKSDDSATIGEDRLKEEIISSSLHLVVSIAKTYASDESALLELIKIGNEGVIDAVKCLGDVHNCDFPSCITYWIRNKIDEVIRSHNNTNNEKKESSLLLS